MADSAIPVLPPEEAIGFFGRKGLARSFSWQDIWTAQHDFYFTVAKMLSVSLLEDTHAIILEALKDGRSPQQLGRDLKELLAARGWWGKAMQTDPLTGEQQLVQLGSNRRVQTIVNTNLRTSYAAGRWERQQRTRDAFPILVYKSRMDGRERAQHRAWHNTALPSDNPWWQTHYPPCDWGCRCRTVSMTIKMAERRGLKIGEAPPHFGTRRWLNKRTGEVMTVEKGIGAGWDYHPGRAQLDGLAPDPLFKFSTEDGASIASINRDLAARFMSAFGGDLADAELKGDVWRDATGWPLPITVSWLEGVQLAQQLHLVRAARVMADPDEIRLVWVTGKDGRAMLTRRYIGGTIGGQYVIDVGNSFWRCVRVRAEQLRRLSKGDVIWSRESSAEAAFNSRQARDRNGRWTSGGTSFLAQAMSDKSFVGSQWLGRVGGQAKDRLKALGIDHRATAVMVEAGRARHIHHRHGADSRGQKPITARDIQLAHHILNEGKLNHGNPRTSPNGAHRIFATARIDGAVYGAAFEVGRRRINLVSLRKR